VTSPRVLRFCNWLQSIDPKADFCQHPGYARFADMTDDELCEAETEMVKRYARAAHAWSTGIITDDVA